MKPSLTERRYAACDPENRLIAAQLEKSWEAALLRVQSCEKVVAEQTDQEANLEMPDFISLAEDLKTAWKAPGTTMRTRQRLVRSMVGGHHRRCR